MNLTMELLLVIAVIAVFELAALRWGVDSRDLFGLNALDRLDGFDTLDSLDRFDPSRRD